MKSKITILFSHIVNNISLLRLFAVLSFLSLIIMSFAFHASTAQNTIPNPRLSDASSSIGVANLKPTQCASIAVTITRYVTATNYNGNSSSELILGSSNNNNINGGNGNDCIIGGAGGDTIKGGPGNDVCIGGPDTDNFDSTCEVQIQGDPTY